MGADELLATASQRTGLDDIGEDTFREGLERLVHSLRTEASLNELGAAVLPEMLLNHLSQRLQLEDWYRRHPEIDDEPIVAPLIGLGLPRTGSTALSNLLGEDPNGNIIGRHRSTGIGRPAFWDRARYYGEEQRLAAALDASMVNVDV